MYTVIFHREASDRNGDLSPNVLKMRYCNSLNDVYNYVKLETFEQHRLEKEYKIYKGMSYYYGDYGFLVMKNGFAVEIDYSFIDGFREWDIPCSGDNEISSMLIESRSDGGQLFRVIEEFKTNYVDIEEKLLKAAIVEDKETKQKEEQERKERKLLKVLMQKYPEVK